MAERRPDTMTELATLEVAYRKSLWTVIGHAVFFVVCCTIAVILRRLFKMPPALLTVVFAVALVLFGGDIWRFFSYRRRLRRMRESLN
jgi:putative Ca2+/H+ antiporter (TMEM165/GDT1 family)